jgi:hypothetical protein
MRPAPWHPRISVVRALVLSLSLALLPALSLPFSTRSADASEGDAGSTPRVIRGPKLEPRASRPTGSEAWPRACSFRHPLCVHASAHVGAPQVLAALASFERAWDMVTGVLRLPAPDPDLDGAYDVYMVDDVLGDAMTYVSERDPRASFDRASAFTLIDARLAAGCSMDERAAREVARASLTRVSPATDEGSARAATEYFARLMVPCAMADADGVSEFQRYAYRSVVDTFRESAPKIGDAYDLGASLFFWWIDATFGSEPGGLVRAMWALSPTRTPLGSERWDDQPDGFEVLRFTFKGALGSLSTLDDLFVEFAIARAFFGDADDGQHLLESRALGSAGRVRLDWDVPWPAEPRRFASPNAVAPSGATYVAVRRAGAPPGSRLRVEAEWEEHARMRWTAVKIDAHGKKMASVPIVGFDRGTESGMTIGELDGVDTVLLVGVNIGDALVPFDPEDEVWEPHGWVLSVMAR